MSEQVRKPRILDEKRWWERPLGIVALTVVSGLIVWLISRHYDTPTPSTVTEAQETPSPAPSGATSSSAPIIKAPLESGPKPREPKIKIEQHGEGSGAVGGNIRQGPCSNLQIGGAENTASTNCAPQLRIPDQKIGKLAGLLPSQPGSSVSITVRNADGMTNQDATNLLTAFAATHCWNTAGVNQIIHGTDIGADGLPVRDPAGIHIYARPERLVLAQSVRKALNTIGVQSVVETQESVTGVDIDILVGASQ